MCISSGASFAAAGLLLPLGLIALRQAERQQLPGLLPLAAMPLGFGVQQSLEGLVWMAIGAQGTAPLTALGRWAALAYLGFALALWLVWVPLLAWNLCPASARWRRGTILTLLLLGLIGGGLLWMPLLLAPQQLVVTVVQGSLHYGIEGPLRGMAGELSGRLLYGLVIVLPLLLVPCRRLPFFALLLLLGFVIAWQGWSHAFGSLWCFLSALLSLLVLWVMADPALRHLAAQPALLPLEGSAPASP